MSNFQMLFVLMALPLISSAQAAISPTVFKCQHMEKEGRLVTIEVEQTRATLIGFRRAGERDPGLRRKNSKAGEIIYRGFEGFVDNGEVNSGFLIIPPSTLKAGRGLMTLTNLYCEDSCGSRTFTFSCKKLQFSAF